MEELYKQLELAEDNCNFYQADKLRAKIQRLEWEMLGQKLKNKKQKYEQHLKIISQI